MSSSVLRLRATLAVRLHEDTTNESEPEVHVWLSQNACSGMFRSPLKVYGEKTRWDGEVSDAIEVDYSFDCVDAQRDGHTREIRELLWAANVNVDLWSRVTNKQGVSCLNQSGSLKVPLYTLLSMQKRNNNEDASPSPLTARIEVPSWVPEDHPNDKALNDKGTLTLDKVSVLLDDEPLEPPPLSFVHSLGRIETFQTHTFASYINSCMALSRTMEPTWPAVHRVNSFVYRCRSGLLPACAFLLNRTGGTQGTYFVRAAEQVLRRSGRAIGTFDWLRDAYGPVALAEVLTLAANLMAYVPDIVFLPSREHRKAYLRCALESFDLARTRLGGDCEDLALEILLEAAELLECDLKRVDSDLRAPLSQMKQLASMYVFAMTLGGVSSAEINGDYGKLKRMGAHMWSMMIWRELWDRWRENGNGPAAPRGEMRAPPGGHYVLCLEGTGFLRPDPADDGEATAEERLQELLEACAAKGTMAGARKRFLFRLDHEGHFYRTAQVMFTRDYLGRRDPRERHIAFHVCRPGARPTRGVEFNTIAAGRPADVGLWSQPALSEAEHACCVNAMRDQHPMPALVAVPGSRGTFNTISITGGDALVRYSKERESLCYAQWFLRSELYTDARLKAIREACARSDGILLAATLDREDVSSTFSAYRIRVYARRSDVDSRAESVTIARTAEREGVDDPDDTD